MKKTGVVGFKGKLGSLLLGKPSFVALDCDVTNPLSIEKALRYTPVDLIVNCAGISSPDECEKDYEKAIKVNVHGLANLHRVFGERVLNISSDHVFNGASWFLPTEETDQSPVNKYGKSKLGSEGISSLNNGKTIRLSRTVSVEDKDISAYLLGIYNGLETYVPSFFQRNYIHKKLAVDGIEYFARNYNEMPTLVNYGGSDNVSMYDLIKLLAMYLKLDDKLVLKKKEYNTSLVPRPKKGGFKIDLAKKLGFPIPKLFDTVPMLEQETHA